MIAYCESSKTWRAEKNKAQQGHHNSRNYSVARLTVGWRSRGFCGKAIGNAVRCSLIEVKEMDLHGLNEEMLFFDQPQPHRVGELMLLAAEHSGHDRSEAYLLEALTLAPNDLVVLVGLYRAYYRQNRFADALNVALNIMANIGSQIQFPEQWEELNMNTVGLGVLNSMALVRIYLLALKGAGYLKIRMGDFDEGMQMLRKVSELDAADRLDIKALLRRCEKEGSGLSDPPQFREAI